MRGEPALLAAVFQNLIGNALKFRGEGAPHVAISATCEIGDGADGADDGPGEWVFACSDDGIGIEPEYADRIFMIFQRLHAKDAYAGTGIGLAMCRKIVEYHGGRIWLDTAAPAGRTTFHFTLPASTRSPHRDEPAPAVEPDRRAARRRRPGRHAHDPRGVRAQQGAQRARVVTDGVQAMQYLRREGEYADAPRPDLILLDLNLPRKDGREVLAEIKGDPQLATIPVVVLTTSHAEEDVLRSYQLHANAYVTKPVDFERFIEVVRQIDEFFVTVVKLPKL